MQKRLIALSAAMVVILGSGAAYAGETWLYAPMLSAPVGGSLECHVTNIGKKTIPEIYIRRVFNGGGGGSSCPDVPPQYNAGIDATCSSVTGGSVLFSIRITGGSYRSLRAVVNVVDSSGATILSVPVTK